MQTQDTQGGLCEGPALCGKKGVRLVVWVGRALLEKAAPGYLISGDYFPPLNIFIIAACIRPWMLSYLV